MRVASTVQNLLFLELFKLVALVALPFLQDICQHESHSVFFIYIISGYTILFVVFVFFYLFQLRPRYYENWLAKANNTTKFPQYDLHLSNLLEI